MRDNLDDSLKLMFGDEGGYSNVETDSGGPTKYGITHKTLAAHRGVKSVTAATVKALKIDEAEEIYRRAYWAQAGGDVLPAGLDYAVFDFGVNSGPPKAVKTLQKVLGTTPDGWVGTETLRLIAEYPGGVTRLITDYCNARMAFLRSLKNPKTGFPVNGRGWTRRVLGTDPKGEWAPEPGVVGNALKLARKQPVPVPRPMPAGEIADTASAKAEPKKPNPMLTPEMGLTVASGAATVGGAAFTSGFDPIRIAVAVGILAIVVLAGFFIYKRFIKEPAV